MRGRVDMPAGPGRPKGVPNKTTVLARAAIEEFINGNVERLNGWLDSIAVQDPKDAFNCFMAVLEYNIPKLARHTLTGDEANPVVVKAHASDQDIINRYLQRKNGNDSRTDQK